MAIFDILILSTIAGLATGIGALLIIIGKPGKILFGFLIGLAAGVMLELSFFELLLTAIEFDFFMALLFFAIGAFLFFFIDSVMPHIRFEALEVVRDKRFAKIGILIAIGIAIHNIPEGIAVAAGYVTRPTLGILIALGIALHNLPEGIATALPLYAARMRRATILAIALISGLTEPIGALLAAVILREIAVYAYLGLAFAAGIMIFLTLDELIPIARRHVHGHAISLGVLVGIIGMAIISKVLGA